MGLTGSKKKENSSEETEKEEVCQQRNYIARTRARPDDMIAKYTEIFRTKGVLPEFFLVHESKSSQYVDEDGDVANEFYQETISDGEKHRLCRLMKNLRPKGKERYKIPRLKPDLPVVLWEIGTNQ
ncbi:unnamed protein product [Caenorhabditis angaria]|uniref:Uncharacterized protein n=1 Tax=Caenorhabditis angaria TaxID=860376 RepID=A0A9P1IQU5_9PELO|nr:unnamed protein product [Caenorhabditis angaria]